MTEKKVTKRVKFPQYEVLKMLQERYNLTEISAYRHTSRTSTYKIIHTLINKGMIRKIRRAVYELTNKGIQGLHSFVASRYKLRQHNLHFKIKVLESPKNWELKRNQLRQLPYFNKILKLKNNEQELFNFGKISVKTTSKSVIVKIPTIYAINWENALIQAISILEDNIPKIEQSFGIMLVKDYKANITIISQEYARIQDALAKLYKSENNRIYLTGEDGKIWLITDFSFSENELEFIHPNKATDDLDAIAPFLNDLRKNPITLTEVREETRKVLEVAKAHAININKHQRVLDEMLNEFKEFRKWRERK